MVAASDFDRYMTHLSEALGHADRRAGLRGYCTGLMLPLQRKSVEPMAAAVDGEHVSARHQSLHHFVAKADWDDRLLLRRVAQWVVPHMDFSGGGYWVIDDTGFPKKGNHSVGVARQYCGVLGKQDNCQVAVSISLACEQASLPVAWQLYLPQAWAQDSERRAKAGVPADVKFATKPEMAVSMLETLLAEGAPRHCVLADAGYGVDSGFRKALAAKGLDYVVGITSAMVVWPPGMQPLSPKLYGGNGRPPSRLQRAPGHEPLSVKELAASLPAQAWQSITWRQGSNNALSSRFAAVRVRCAGGNTGRYRLQPEQWLLIQWPEAQAEPEKYYLSNLPESTSIQELVSAAHMRWRIERDYQDLKQDLGLGHYEGRGWKGFHHHATLSIAAYGFLVAQRLKGSPASGKKNAASIKEPSLPEDYVPRGSPQGSKTRPRLDSNITSDAGGQSCQTDGLQ